ncbi:MAG: hypothetical protein K0Q50_1687 [Vampirovibrio sp.]|nr:hypothetical protein [Vampirovibrio sp.]
MQMPALYFGRAVSTTQHGNRNTPKPHQPVNSAYPTEKRMDTLERNLKTAPLKASTQQPTSQSKKVHFHEPVEIVPLANGRTLAINRQAFTDIKLLETDLQRQFRTLKRQSAQWFRISATSRTRVITEQILMTEQSKKNRRNRYQLRHDVEHLLKGFGPETDTVTWEFLKILRKRLTDSAQKTQEAIGRLRKLQLLNPLGPNKQLLTMQTTLQRYTEALGRLFPDNALRPAQTTDMPK